MKSGDLFSLAGSLLILSLGLYVVVLSFSCSTDSNTRYILTVPIAFACLNLCRVINQDWLSLMFFRYTVRILLVVSYIGDLIFIFFWFFLLDPSCPVYSNYEIGFGVVYTFYLFIEMQGFLDLMETFD